jgi:hypothetical protein
MTPHVSLPVDHSRRHGGVRLVSGRRIRHFLLFTFAEITTGFDQSRSTARRLLLCHPLLTFQTAFIETTGGYGNNAAVTLLDATFPGVRSATNVVFVNGVSAVNIPSRNRHLFSYSWS